MSSRQAVLAVATLFLLLAILHTWPLATAPATLSRLDNADTALNAWIVSWVARQLPRDPTHVFDANIFHPAPSALALSEPLIVPGILAIPIRALGASPLLAYNLLLLIGFVLTGLAMYVTVAAWTGDRLAGVVAGAILAFNTHTLSRLPHLQALHAQWLPLAFLALERLLSGGRTRDAAWLALFVTLLALTSGYLALLAVVGLTAAFLVRADRWARRDGTAIVLRLLLAGAITAAVAWLVLAPYRSAYASASRVRSLEEVERYSADWSSYLSTVGRLHFAAWSHRFYGRTAETLFPGVVPLALAAAALIPLRRLATDGPARMLLATGLVGVVLSLGPATPLYEWLYAWFPPMQGARAAARFGLLALFAVAGLAGVAVARFNRSRHGVGQGAGWRPRLGPSGLATVVLALVTLETLAAPMSYVPFEGFSPVYRAIARDPAPGAVVEFPLYPPELIHLNAGYVLASTEHWRPLVNGYSGSVPETYTRLAAQLADFPSAATLPLLADLGVTHVVVHLDRYDEADRDRILRALAQRPELRLVVEDESGTRLYRLGPSPDQ